MSAAGFRSITSGYMRTKTPPNGIEKALAWLQANYSGATKSPIASAPQTSASGSKAGAMYEKYLVNKGFSWDAATGKYFQTGGEMGHTRSEEHTSELQ